MIAAKELPLQVRLSMNMTRLKDIENARLGGYGWFGGLVVLAELRRRVADLREVLKLPPCESFADLDEVSKSNLHLICTFILLMESSSIGVHYYHMNIPNYVVIQSIFLDKEMVRICVMHCNVMHCSLDTGRRDPYKC